MNHVVLGSVRLGEAIIFAIKLQLFWFVAVFRYGVIFGVFPATAAAYECYFEIFKERENISLLTLNQVLKKTKAHVKKANQVGFISLSLFLLLMLDLRITGKLIHNTYVHVILIALLVLFLAVNLYLFPVLIRYDLKVKDIFKQSFFLILCSVPNTLASLFSLAISMYLSILFPLLGLLPVPIFILSVAHFSYQALIRLEEANLRELDHGKE